MYGADTNDCYTATRPVNGFGALNIVHKIANTNTQRIRNNFKGL